jgi:hypothetical protein
MLTRQHVDAAPVATSGLRINRSLATGTFHMASFDRRSGKENLPPKTQISFIVSQLEASLISENENGSPKVSVEDQLL